jgi:sulfite exporter TauE/SafE
MGVGMNAAITHLQLFAIGLSLGFAGPCLLTCAPLIVTYIAGRRISFLQSIRDILIFLSGRLLAYIALGYAAGFFAPYIRLVANKVFLPWLRLLASVIIILMGIYVAIGENLLNKICPARLSKATGISSLFLLGVIIGLSPCPPLMALLIELAIISKNGLDAVFYALSFGLGTFIAGFLTLGVLCGFFSGLAAKIFHSRKTNLTFRIVCAALLILLGLNLIFVVFKITF